jgi:hypothetical protein
VWLRDKRLFFLKQTKGEEMAEVYIHFAFCGRVIYGPGLFSFLCASRVSLLCTFHASIVFTVSAHRKELSSLYVNHKGKRLEVS